MNKLHNAKATHSIYFFCNPLPNLEVTPNVNTDYQHCIVSLAEGLTELGYECVGNIRYWQSDVGSQYLIKERPIESIADKSNCIAIVVSGHWFRTHNKLPDNIRKLPLILMADQQEESKFILKHPLLKKFDCILLAGYLSCYKYDANVRSWAFGLTHRVIKALDTKVLFESRKNEMLVNFRMVHTSRQLALMHVIPQLQNMFKVYHHIDSNYQQSPYDAFMSMQTGQRHYSDYFQTLLSVQAVAAFGGYFAVALTRNQLGLLNRLVFKFIRTFKLSSHVLLQHDSWRFWEGLAAGCVVFQADLDACQVQYPVQPQNFEHYVGFLPELFRGKSASAFYSKLSNVNFAQIAANGQQFVLAHYSPKPVAERFLNILSQVKKF